MKIGIMLRHYNQHGGGVKNYTEYLLEEMFQLNSEHEFVLIYNNPSFIGIYNHFKNVREIAVKMSSRFLWDQIGIPRIHRREKFDLIYNPKYSVPLLINCPTIFVCHGLNSYLMPWGSKRIDMLYRKYIYPLYASNATGIVAVSNTTKDHLMNFLNVKEEKIFTVCEGMHEDFRKKIDKKELDKTRKEYKLPERFFLFAGQIYPPKNFGRILQAYAKVGPKQGIHLVATGEHRWLCEDELKLIDKLGISDWVVRTGWIDNNTLIQIYKLAEALVFPSLYESFGTPIVEAMAGGCPVVTSGRFGNGEVAGDAAILVDPENIDDIAQGMQKIINNKELREELILKGFEQSKQYSWKRAANEMLKVFNTVSKIPKNRKIKFNSVTVTSKYEHMLIKKPTEFLNLE
jgi:O-antigen biosynthesis alpha-1,2-mannosyltransferase